MKTILHYAVVQIALILLKATEVITWSWWIVLMPSWIMFLTTYTILLIMMTLTVLGYEDWRE